MKFRNKHEEWKYDAKYRRVRRRIKRLANKERRQKEKEEIKRLLSEEGL